MSANRMVSALITSLLLSVAFVFAQVAADENAMWPDEACAERTIVDQPALIDTKWWAPLIATSSRIFRLSYHIETFDRSEGWGKANLIRSVRPPGYVGKMSLGAVVVNKSPTGHTAWIVQWEEKVMQELFLPASNSADITAVTTVGGGALTPSTTPQPGKAVKLWNLASLAYHGGRVYSVTESGGPSSPKMVVARTESPYSTQAFTMPCKARAIALNSASRAFIVCYATSARVFRIDLDPATGLPTGSQRQVGTVTVQWPPPHVATIIGREERPTLFTAGHLQPLVAVNFASDFGSSTTTTVTADGGQGVTPVMFLQSDGDDVYIGRQDRPAVALRCADILADGRCGRQEYVEERQVHDGSDYRQILLHNNTAYQFGSEIRTFRRDGPGQQLSFHKQFSPPEYQTAAEFKFSTGSFYTFSEGATWLPGTAKPTAWIAGSSARRIFQMEVQGDGDVAVSLVAGGGPSVPAVGSAPIDGTAAKLSYVSQLTVAGDYVFSGPALKSSISPSQLIRVERKSPHKIEAFSHPCVFRAITAHDHVLYAVCWETGSVRLMATETYNWRPTRPWSVLHRFSWGWAPPATMVMTGGSVLWIAKWDDLLAKVTLKKDTRSSSAVPAVSSVSTVALGARKPFLANTDGLDVWITSLANPFELRCLRTAPTPAPPTPPPATPIPTGSPTTPSPPGGAPGGRVPDTPASPSSSSGGLRVVIIAAAAGGLAVALIAISIAVAYCLCCRGKPEPPTTALPQRQHNVAPTMAAPNAIPVVAVYGQTTGDATAVPVLAVPVETHVVQPEVPHKW